MSDKVLEIKRFLLTGFGDQEKVDMISIIKSLQSVYVQPLVASETFLPTCTHVVAKKPCRSEKYLCACAAGKWLLAGQYLIDSKKAGKWLKEADYEWGGERFRGPFPVNMQDAPKRWRLRRSKADGHPPFHNWCVGIRSTADRAKLYKRLIEIGGGQAIVLPSTNDQNLTHVIAEKDRRNSVKQYHKRGIPTVRCEFLAQHLLQYPPPPVAKFSLFPNISKATSSSSHSTTSASSSRSNFKQSAEAHSKGECANNTELEAKDTEITSACNTNMPHSYLHTHENHQTTTVAKSVQPNRSDSATISKRHEIPCHANDAACPSKSREVTFTHESLSFKSKPDTLSSEIKEKKSSSSSSISVVPTIAQFQSFSPESKTVAASMAESTDSTIFGANTKKRSFDNNSAKPQEKLNLADYEMTYRGKATRTWKTPDWLKKKRSQIQEAQKKISLKSDSSASTPAALPPSPASEVPPRRFGKRELGMLEIFVDAVHSRSILLTCGMLMSKTLYPPADLLYLLMKKYVLDSECRLEASQTVIFLNSLLDLHPPTASHIRHDDVYTQALATTDATESKLLSSAKLKPSDKISLWNVEDLESVEWKFLHSVIKQAMLSTATVRRFNAISLLTFLTSVLESHPALTRRIFWSKSQKVFYSKPVKSLFSYFRQAAEAEAKTLPPDEEDEDDNEMSVEGEDANDGDDSDDDSATDEENMAATNAFACLKNIVNSVIAIVDSEHKGTVVPGGHGFIVSGLAEAFRDVDHVVLENMLYTVNLPSKTSLICMILERNFCSGLAKAEKDTSLSLRLIVDRYFHFLPRPPTLNAKEWTLTVSRDRNSTQMCKTTADSPGHQHESSDKENFISLKPEPATSPGSASRLTASTVNLRNHNGETPLHRACMQNQPAKVAQLLRIEGIDPNARDNLGWTPLGEACNHGNEKCVEELLRLPLASFPDQVSTNDPGFEPSVPRLEIDLLACPVENGTTPLHDALNNGHIEVARLLFEKGGAGLLRVSNIQGYTPLDVCATEEMKNLILELACEISSKQNENVVMEESHEMDTFSISCTKAYQKVLPPISILTCSGWKKSCLLYTTLIRHLVSTYLSESRLLQLLFHLSLASHGPSDVPNELLEDDVTEMEIEPCENCPLDDASEQHNDVSKLLSLEQDLFCLCSWQEIEEAFQKHLRIVTGDQSRSSNEFGCLKTDFVKSVVQLLKV